MQACTIREKERTSAPLSGIRPSLAAPKPLTDSKRDLSESMHPSVAVQDAPTPRPQPHPPPARLDVAGNWILLKRFSHLLALHDALVRDLPAYAAAPPCEARALIAERRRSRPAPRAPRPAPRAPRPAPRPVPRAPGRRR
jgi:hypothetical protein